MTDAITITVVATKGSVPRGTGTSMQVFADRIVGTIGGGNLEWQAMARARAMLSKGRTHDTQVLTLGPDMGQCCGGVVTLNYTVELEATQHIETNMFIWGAGHVGRAVSAVLAPLGNLQITLIDDATKRLPDTLAQDVQPMVAADMVAAVKHMPRSADHLIVTYSHDIDLALCDALLRHGFHGCGLIGSKTKWARFQSRLRSLGHDDAEISRIACPIGDPSLGKHPQAIAIGVAAGLLSASGKRRLGGGTRGSTAEN